MQQSVRVAKGVKTMAARGLVNGRGPLRRSGRDLVFTPFATRTDQ